jgi:hypothetical protein
VRESEEGRSEGEDKRKGKGGAFMIWDEEELKEESFLIDGLGL